jgi:hypothetical protein
MYCRQLVGSPFARRWRRWHFVTLGTPPSQFAPNHLRRLVKGGEGGRVHPMMAVPATVRTVAWTPEADTTEKSTFNWSIIFLKKKGTWMFRSLHISNPISTKEQTLAPTSKDSATTTRTRNPILSYPDSERTPSDWRKWIDVPWARYT